MNRLVLIFLGLHLSLAGYGQTQVYVKPLPPDPSAWQVDNFNQPGQPGCGAYAPYCWSNRYRLQGDTVIGTKAYKKIRETNDFNYYYNGVNGYFTGDSLYHNYLCAVREDTLAKTVFLYLPGKQTDTLLYTYNLSVGDTFPASYLCPRSVRSAYVVRKIDTIMIGSGHYRRFLFSTASGPSPLPSLIQGVGSSQGFLVPFYSFFEAGPWLECFNRNQVPDPFIAPVFPNECSSSFSTGISDEQIPLFKLAPNPSSDGMFYLRSAGNHTLTLEVYTVLGKKIFVSQSIENSPEINLSTQAKGIYFYRLVSENKIIGNGKLVIQ